MAFFAIPEAEASDMPCYLWVKGTPTYDVVDPFGNPRNNPDQTLYPGDEFSYTFVAGFSVLCYGEEVNKPTGHGSVHTIPPVDSSNSYTKTGTAGILIPEANDCHGGGSKGARGYGGEDGWKTRWGDSKNCGKLSLTIEAYEIHCPDEGPCYPVYRSRTATITPRVVAPVVEVGLIEHILQDPEMYMAANRDYTNYPWDPIAIEHIAHFKHRDAREGTITFDYIRPHDLVEEGGYECDAKCNEMLRVDGGFRNATGIGFLPYPHTSYSGGGMYAYTGEDLNSTGLHDIIYDVTVRNEGRMINTHSNHTEQLIVNYDPQFEHYEYTVLKDGNKYAYDDRIGMVIHYLGSEGSGPDDEDKLHEDRRTKITDFEPRTFSSTPLNFTDFDDDYELFGPNSTEPGPLDFEDEYERPGPPTKSEPADVDEAPESNSTDTEPLDFEDEYERPGPPTKSGPADVDETPESDPADAEPVDFEDAYELPVPLTARQTSSDDFEDEYERPGPPTKSEPVDFDDSGELPASPPTKSEPVDFEDAYERPGSDPADTKTGGTAVNGTNSTGQVPWHYPELDIDPDLLKWNSTDFINGTDPDGWVSKGAHAMFEDEGYGIIRLYQNITNIIFEQERQEAWYFNTTVTNNITSVYFAGHERYELYNYTYVYPDTPFSQYWNLTSYDNTGGISPDNLTVSAYPPEITHDAETIGVIEEDEGNDYRTIYLDEYLYAKTLYDTDDEHFATAVKNSTYAMSNNLTGTGQISMWLNKTALTFSPSFFPTDNFTLPELDFKLPDLEGGEEIKPEDLVPVNRNIEQDITATGNLEDIVPINRNGILDFDRYLSLDLDAIMRIDMMADERERAVEESMDFTFPHHEKINLDSGNKMDVERIITSSPTSQVRMNVTDYFGVVKTVTVGLLEKGFTGDCVRGCTVITNAGTTLEIENVWGGTATGTVNSTQSFYDKQGPRNFESANQYILFVFVALLPAYLAYVVMKNHYNQKDDE